MLNKPEPFKIQDELGKRAGRGSAITKDVRQWIVTNDRLRWDKPGWFTTKMACRKYLLRRQVFQGTDLFSTRYF